MQLLTFSFPQPISSLIEKKKRSLIRQSKGKMETRAASFPMPPPRCACAASSQQLFAAYSFPSFPPSAIILHLLLLEGGRVTVLESRILSVAAAEEQPMLLLPFPSLCCLFVLELAAAAVKDLGLVVLVLFRCRRTSSSSFWRAQRCRQKSSLSQRVTWPRCPCRTGSEQQICLMFPLPPNIWVGIAV